METILDMNIFVPYSRQYTLNKYLIDDVLDIFEIETEIIANYITRLTHHSSVDRIVLYTNEKESFQNIKSTKLEIQARAKETETLNNRASLIEIGKEIFFKNNFIQANPLFPMISINTLRNINDMMNQGSTNCFLGLEGDAYTVEEERKKLQASGRQFMDLGALTAYSTNADNEIWQACTDFQTFEMINLRSKQDVPMIKAAMNMGIFA